MKQSILLTLTLQLIPTPRDMIYIIRREGSEILTGGFNFLHERKSIHWPEQ